MKSYNILKIIFLLLVNEKTTVKALSEELEVSTRTVKRYISDIICLDLPIYTVSGKNGGVYFNKEEFYQKNNITNREIDYIIDALHANNSLDFLFKGDYLDFSEILKRVKVNNIVEIDFSKWFHNTEEDINFSIIKRSISAMKQIEFDYYDMYNNFSHRVVEPYKIGYKENTWYLLGYCHLRNDVRIFKIRKMRNINLLKTSFFKRKEIDFDFSAYLKNKKKITLKMIVSKEVLSKVYEDFEDNEIEELDNYVQITSTRVDNPGLLFLVMSYGGFAKIISPENIKEKLIKNAEKVKKNYEGDIDCPFDNL